MSQVEIKLATIKLFIYLDEATQHNFVTED
jgi:hypothetical protein